MSNGWSSSHINETLSKKLYSESFRKEYNNRLKEGTAQLEEFLKDKFDNILTELFSKDLKHIASSVQFDSPSIGEWIRVRMSKDSEYDPDSQHCGLSHPEAAYFEQLHKAAPRQSNLLFSDDLGRPIQIQFGDDKARRGDVVHVSTETWIKLRDVIKDNKNGIKDPEQFILGESDRTKYDDFERRFGRDLKPLMKSFLDKLLLVQKRAWRQEHSAFVGKFRLFLFTYLYTIMQAPPKRNSKKGVYHLIVPLREHGIYLGTYCGAFKQPMDTDQIKAFEAGFSDLIIKLRLFESLTFQKLEMVEPAGPENVIRLCAQIPLDNQIPPQMNLFSQRLDNISKQLEKSLDGDDNIKRKLAYWNANIDEAKEKLVSADPTFLSLIEDLYTFVGGIGSHKGGIVFLHSEPGLGKGSLAKLVHYFSPRSYDREGLNKLIKKSKKGLPAEYTRGSSYVSNVWNRQYKEEERWVRILSNQGTVSNRMWKGMGDFNFDEIHAGKLTPGEYRDFLFGNNKKAGLLASLHLRGGTLFLDEIHTINRDVLLALHRIWEEPFEIVPQNSNASIQDINILMVLAGNESPDQLKQHKFDEAILSRITQFAFEIPPLRERKQDIALLVNHLIRKHNHENSNEKIVSIDLNGLRTLTELKWKDKNARGVKQFVDELLMLRSSKQLRRERARKISFEEIIQCLARRELL